MALIKFSSVAARGLLAGCKQFLRAASTAAAETSSATPSAPATTTPSYTITELPVDKGAAVTRKVVASMKGIRGHSKKLNPVARQIAGLSVSEAIAQLSFSPSSRGPAVKKAIERAAKQADLRHALPKDKLMIEAAWTGKNMTVPRMRHHSKGRAGRSHYRTSMVSIRLREMDAKEEKRLNKFKAMAAARKLGLDPRGVILGHVSSRAIRIAPSKACAISNSSGSSLAPAIDIPFVAVVDLHAEPCRG